MEIEGRLFHSILFPGDTLKCMVVVSNPTSEPRNLALLSVQVYGQSSVDPSWVKFPPYKINTKLIQGQGHGSFLPQLDPKTGQFIFSSPQTLIAWDLTVPPQKSRSVLFSLQLPSNLFPSFSGSIVRYSYFVTLMGQASSNLPQYLRLPLRIFNPAAGIAQCTQENVTNDGYNISFSDQQSDSPIRALIDNYNSDRGRMWASSDSTADIISVTEKTTKATIAQLFSSSGSKSFNITKQNLLVGKFSISSSALKIGDVMKGHFDFTNREIPCQQVFVTLQYSEKIDGGVIMPSRLPMNPQTHTVDTFTAFTQHTKHTSFIFEIPFESTPQFSTELVEIQWLLKIQFCLQIQGTPSNRVDVLSWDLPIRILTPYYPEELDTSEIHQKWVMKL